MPAAAPPRLAAALAQRYRIAEPLGEGGMAMVYLADDLKHNRQVALKVLKPELAAVVGAERFLAEIETTANLQHPHILPLFDSGEADGFLYYVMPFVDGETLRDRLDRQHQLPVEEAVRIATNVAEALDYAHSRGVIHRDIKPANILLQSGKPVLSDFGIALAVGAAGGGRLTETGLSMGTPHYMSPEQATGDQSVGAASDLYALGCVLYEMLVGEPPYTGSTAQAILGKIISGTPTSASAERPSIPPNVDATIARALEKVPADRFASAADFSRALSDPGFRHGADGGAAGGASRGRWSPLSVASTAAAVVLLAILGWSAVSAPERVPGQVVAVPLELADGDANGFALSPDGSFVLYGVRNISVDEAWIRRLDELEPEEQSVDCCSLARISPDGESYVDFNPVIGATWVWSITAGTRLRQLPDGPRDYAWGPEGALYFITPENELLRWEEEAADPSRVVAFPPELDLRDFDVLPHGRAMLAVDHSGPAGTEVVVVVSFEDGTVTPVFPGFGPRYAASGHLVFVRSDGALMAAPFDVDRMTAVGTGIPLGPSTRLRSGGRVDLQISRDGSLLYSTGEDRRERMVRLTREGGEAYLDPDEAEDFGRLELSPDGRRVATSIDLPDGSGRRVVVKSLPDGPLSVIAETDFTGGGSIYPAWDATGRWIYFNRQGDLWRVPSDGSAPAGLFFETDLPIAESRVLEDGTLILRTFPYGEGRREIYLLSPGDSIPRAFAPSTADEAGPVLSPDGRWMAYQSGASATDRSEVFIRPFPAGDALYPVSTDGGLRPEWANSGAELFFLSAEGDLMVVDVEPEGADELTLSIPRVLSRRTRDFGQNYEVFPDDQSFLFMEPEGEGQQFVLVLNFFEELNRRVPVRE